MARQGRKVNGALLERLIEESPYSVAAFGREFARLRLKRKPTPPEAESARSQIQKIIREDSGVGARNLRLIAEVLEVEPEAFLYEEAPPVEFQPSPVAIMQEALENQREMRVRLESLEEQVAEAVSLTREALQMLGELRAPQKAVSDG